jgi:6-pyruvoyltetrahydropterin/6-carboxytetrahydropterin synthase
MRAYLGRRYRLSASHRLHSDIFSEDENYSIYGKCNNPYGHGHNYVIEIVVGGEVDPVTGMVCDLVQLDATVQKEILDRFDHMNLNTLDLFHTSVPTTENFCMEIHRLLQQAITQAELISVRVEETAKNSFEYPVLPITPSDRRVEAPVEVRRKAGGA